MNDPENMPLDDEQILELQQWVSAEKARSGLSWEAFGKVVGRSYGTIQPFSKGAYNGDNLAVARDIYRYRQMIEAQRDRIRVPTEPAYVKTPTAIRLLELLSTAHSGEITLAATAPGTSKTKTIEHYAHCHPNVWVATMEKATEKMNAMLWEVARAVGQPLKYQWSNGASRQIMDAVAGRSGLIVIDEANHLGYAALEQLRAIHDKTGVGLALFGNEELLRRMQDGRWRDSFARLHSRLELSIIQDGPTEEDVIAFCEGWEIRDPAMLKMLTSVALTPASGGLREIGKIIKLGSKLAISDERPLSLADLKDAHQTRFTRNIRC